MTLQEPIDAARYSPRLWWLMLAGVAAAAPAIDGLLYWLVVLVLCALLRWEIGRAHV